jgi:hypothetical protein
MTEEQLREMMRAVFALSHADFGAWCTQMMKDDPPEPKSPEPNP